MKKALFSLLAAAIAAAVPVHAATFVKDVMLIGGNQSTPTKPVTITQGSTGNKSYTANWTPVTYTIGYDPRGPRASRVGPARPAERIRAGSPHSAFCIQHSEFSRIRATLCGLRVRTPRRAEQGGPNPRSVSGGVHGVGNLRFAGGVCPGGSRALVLC